MEAPQDTQPDWRALAWVLALCCLLQTTEPYLGVDYSPSWKLYDLGVPWWIAKMIPALAILTIATFAACRVFGRRQLLASFHRQWRAVAWSVVLVPAIVVVGFVVFGNGLDLGLESLSEPVHTITSTVAWSGLLLVLVQHGKVDFWLAVPILAFVGVIDTFATISVTAVGEPQPQSFGMLAGILAFSFLYTIWLSVLLRRLHWNLVTVALMLSAITLALSLEAVPLDVADSGNSLLTANGTLLAYVAATVLTYRWTRNNQTA